jgi:hypothetical protein
MMRLRSIELAQIIEANAIVRLELCECVGVLAKAESREITFLEEQNYAVLRRYREPRLNIAGALAKSARLLISLKPIRLSFCQQVSTKLS